MDINRRELLKAGAIAIAGSALAPGISLIQAFADDRVESSSNVRWGMVIDANKCTADCTACTNACRTENNVPFFGDERYDGHWIRKATVTPNVEGAKSHSLPLLCNHCSHPPCRHVCPTAATFKRPDGIVMIDKHRCIGCRYCMVACPYKARTFVFKNSEEWPNKEQPKAAKGVVTKCHFCYHRIEKGILPACVDACRISGEKAMIFGNLKDPQSEIARYVREFSPKGLREDMGLKPKVFYNGI
jgi:tetrathionate reductase subunit B